MNKFKTFKKLLENLDLSYKNLALTHSSYAHDHKIESNERLEFLGDSVLGLLVSEYLYKNYDQSEGKLSQARAHLVCTDNLSRIAKELNIKDMLLVGKSFKNKPLSDAMLADTMESIIGAFYLQYSKVQVKKAVLEILFIKNFLKQGAQSTDYKSQVQELAQKLKQNIKYTCQTEKNDANQLSFKCFLTINSKALAYGKGSTKRQAEQNAARLALKKLQKNGV